MTPTASRNLTLNVTDAAGNNLSGDPAFTVRTGAANPLNGVNVGMTSAPGFADLDGDGDLDAVVGEDVDGDGLSDLTLQINGNHAAATANTYNGGGDANGGWVL